MNGYTAVADDFYINMNLSTEMELPSSRETVLHYFERIQKKYPAMRKFYCRDKRDFVLEEDKERVNLSRSSRRSRRIRTNIVIPRSVR